MIASASTVSFTDVVRGVYTLRITHGQHLTHFDNNFQVQSEAIDRVVVLSEYRVGDTGPADGIIFYDKGSFSDGWRYLEAAPASSEFNAQWGAWGHDVAGTQTGIGTGRANTTLIVARLAQLDETGRAAQIASTININGYQDWFLPSREELSQMHSRRTAIGGFSNNWYWSSSQYNTNDAWNQRFFNGGQGNYYKDGQNRVRVVRAF
jgi:hypothetical protein